MTTSTFQTKYRKARRAITNATGRKMGFHSERNKGNSFYYEVLGSHYRAGELTPKVVLEALKNAFPRSTVKYVPSHNNSFLIS